MYGGMVSSHASSTSTGRHRSRIHEMRPSPGAASTAVASPPSTSVYKRLLNLVKQAWTGVRFALDAELEGEEEEVPRSRPKGLEALCRSTRFSRAELQLLYRGFKQECPAGQVNEHELRAIYARFFPQGAEASKYAHYVFKTFDHEKLGEITFEEFAAGLSILLRGSFQERLHWTFTLYDLNGDGVITKEELLDIVTSVYSLMGQCINPQVEEAAVQEHVERVFRKLDLNNDGVVTIDEFVEFCSKDEAVSKSLSVFDSLL